MRDTTKSSIYRNETFYASIDALEILLQNLQDQNFMPIKQPNTPMHTQLTQKHRVINWQKDTTQEIIKKINFSDSFPGVLDEILGIQCYLFGAWEEEKFKSDKPKEILAKRDGAICISTTNGAIWIAILKEKNRFKLPATYVLKDRLKGIKEDRLPLIFDKSYKTFYEISCDIKDDVGYLYFNFHNGAFSSDKCIKLKYAFEYIKEKVKVVVLMGGVDFFSNGIHLNILEDSKKNGEDGWANINAINDLIKSVIFSPNNLMVSFVRKNAGAGGVFLATACDLVFAKDEVVLNPHYKTIGLSGSEYHTYTLPKRVGENIAKKLTSECLPISALKAKEIGLIDDIIKNKEQLHQLLVQKINREEFDDFLWDKEDFLEENYNLIERYKEDEIKVMYSEFWDEDSIFHTLRAEFVYKICPTATPERLKFN